jgi:hypothetical protein
MALTVFFGTDAWFYPRLEFPPYCALCGDERLPAKEDLAPAPYPYCHIGVTDSPTGIKCYP